MRSFLGLVSSGLSGLSLFSLVGPVVDCGAEGGAGAWACCARTEEPKTGSASAIIKGVADVVRQELKAKGTHFKLRVLDDEQAPVCTFDGKKVINLASNNYLGLTTHPKLREAALEATRKYGVQRWGVT